MCKVKVKLLNGDDQIIEFEEQMTVLDLKEKINKRLNVPIDNQRLIYCGRILQPNEKKLQEYDLDNKVIHLVDSPPNLDNNQPQNSHQQSSQNQQQSSSDQFNTTTIGNSHISIDINLNSSNVHNNAESRIQNITRILGYINRAIDKLEQDPNLPSPSYETNFGFSTVLNDSDNNATSNGNLPNNIQTSTQSITQVGILLPPDNQAIPSQPNQNFFNQLSQEITDVLFNLNGSTRSSNNDNVANSTPSNTANRNQTSSATNQQPPQQQPPTQPQQQSSIGSLIGSLTQRLLGGSLGNITPMIVQGIISDNTQLNNSTTSSATNSTNTQQTPRNRRVTWAEYANLLNNVRQTQERFIPHFNSFQQTLLQRHGSLSVSQAEEEQTRYRLIARCMHHLSHVYHMCSDIYINYTHQQDQTIQVFEPLMRRPPQTSTTELVMTSGAINLGNGGLLPPSSSNSTASTTNSNNFASSLNNRFSSRGLNFGRNTTSMPNNDSRDSSSNNVQTDSTNNQTSNRQDSSWYVLTGQPVQQQSTERVSGNRRSAMFQNMFGASLPNLSSSNNLIINGQPASSNNTSVINLTNLQPATVIVQRDRNVSGNQAQQSTQPTNQQTVNSLRDLFNFGSSGSTQQQRMNVDEETSQTNNQNNTSTNNNIQNSASTTNNQNNASTNSQQRQVPRSNQRVRTPGSSQQIGPGFPYSYIYNFDPHLPCTSNWLVPEIRGRLEVDLQIPNVDMFRPTNETTTNHNDTNAPRNNSDDNSRTSTSAAQQPSTSSSVSTKPVEEFDLFEDLKKLFSSYLEKDELLRRIDRLPGTANNSLSSFIKSMEILDLINKNKSNITLELFMILAQEISVSEFLKIIFKQDIKCLNRAKDQMIHYAKNYAKTKYNSELGKDEQNFFDITSCVDELLNIWKKVLTSSLDELKSEFSERTFSALLSELRANLSVFLRTFTRTFDENNSFASSLYFAIQRIFVDFHTSLSQMFRTNPANVMRAYKNILIQIFPNSNVRNIVVAILSYRIPIVESEPTLERIRFHNRVFNLMDQTTFINDDKKLTNSNFSSSASTSSSSNLTTQMEIDIDDVVQTVNRGHENERNLNYGSENWHFNCPKNWISILKNDREKIFRKNEMNARLSFSSIYKEAYKKK